MFTRVTLAFLMMAASNASGSSCENLKSLQLKDTKITLAEAVPLDPDSAAGGKPYCRVAATLSPTNDSEIKIEVWLPAEGWNHKFQGNGNGGWTGSIAPNLLAREVARGYASAMTDTGHEGGSAIFALGHPEKLIDFGYRSTHEMTVAAKAIIRAYYGEAPKLSYFTGCSAGGRQGLMEAQRFPDDYDGIVAGAPGLNWSGRALESIWIAQAVHRDEASYIPQSKFRSIHDAVLAACDANDGAKDGVLENPMQCRFDPKVMECKAAETSACLTSAQVETVRKIYARFERHGAMIFPGFERGSELGWGTMGGPQPFTIGLDLFRYVVYAEPNWDFRKFNFESDDDLARTARASAALNAMDSDLSKFVRRGGKLIQYHGWSDPQIPPEFSVEYYKSVAEKMGDVARFYRLYMVPGMAHCGGGDGTSNFDMLAALEGWVEQKKAPEQVLARREQDGRTRPLCPFPQVAKYTGAGSINDAVNFTCAVR